MVDPDCPGLVLCQLTGASHSTTSDMGRPQENNSVIIFPVFQLFYINLDLYKCVKYD
jgi:hypothetical protein